MTDYIRAQYYKRALLVALVLLVAACVWIAFHAAPPQPPEPSVVERHDTLWRDTTIYQPTPTDSTPTGRIVYIRVPVVSGEACQGTGTWQDSATYQSPGTPGTPGAPGNPGNRDSIDVPIPIIQKRYDDSLYTAWVSGYQPQLDSLLLHRPEVVTTITRTIVKPAPRWSIGPSVGAGISIDHQRHPGIYMGFTIQYRLWPK